jgi:tetratricopeptide (TPR) repeat protein
VKLAEKAVAASPQNRSYLNTLGLALYRAGKNDEALEKLQIATNVSDADSDLMDLLFVAMVYFKMGRGDDARAGWQAVQKEITSLDSNMDSDNRRLENHARAIDAIEREIFLSEARLLLGVSDDQE